MMDRTTTDRSNERQVRQIDRQNNKTNKQQRDGEIDKITDETDL